LIGHIGASLARIALGTFIGIVLAVPLGILMGVSPAVSTFMTPLLRFFSVLAGIAWIPIATLWFGYGFGAITFVIFNAVFFVVAYNTLLGVTSIPMQLRHAAASLGASRRQIVAEVLLPGALPNIVTGIRTGLGFAWRGLIAAEMIATNVGLGYMLFVARDFYRTEVIVLGMIVIGILWLLIDRLMLAPLERATIERWGLVRRA
jgi:NitT/TauT family transport system permease protein/taurine transport system permease protein